MKCAGGFIASSFRTRLLLAISFFTFPSARGLGGPITLTLTLAAAGDKTLHLHDGAAGLGLDTAVLALLAAVAAAVVWAAHCTTQLPREVSRAAAQDDVCRRTLAPQIPTQELVIVVFYWYEMSKLSF